MAGEARIKLLIGSADDPTAVRAKVQLGMPRLFDDDHVAPSDHTLQVAEALEYAMDALLVDRPANALEFVSQKLREFDEKFVR